MAVYTKRWNDPVGPDDGMRVLITRYRPRGVPTEGEPWDAWTKALAPSVALHAAAYGKNGEAKIAFAEYDKRFREEMQGAKFWLDGFAKNVARGETLTLLCSSACTDPASCHRTIVKALIEEAVRLQSAAREPAKSVRTRRAPS